MKNDDLDLVTCKPCVSVVATSNIRFLVLIGNPNTKYGENDGIWGLRSEVFGWVDFICVNLNGVCDDSTKHQQNPQFRARWPITAVSRRLRAAIKSPFK